LTGFYVDYSQIALPSDLINSQDWAYVVYRPTQQVHGQAAAAAAAAAVRLPAVFSRPVF